MLLKELFEAGSKHVTFCFGRMNPPTIGHKQVLDTMKSQGGDIRIFVSQSQDAKKNPLDYATKIKFIRDMFPEYAKDVVEDANLNTVVKVASYLHDQGYTDATFVAGSDRLADMEKLLKAYNGVEGKAHGYYKFDVLDFVSSGDREDGAEGVAGVSASGARAAAATNDFEGFQEATGAGKLAKALYDAVRQGMGINEDQEITELSDDDAYYKFLIGKLKLDRPLSKREQEFLKTYQMLHKGVKETQMKAKEFIPASKPRNFVAKNQKTAGAGAHKDKKRAEKQGDIKHKGKQFEQGVAEGSDDLVQIEYWQQDTMESGRWVRTKPMPRDRAEKIVGSFERGEIVDAEQGVAEGSLEEYGDTDKGQKMLTKVQKRAVDRMIKADDKRDAKGAKKNQQTANRAWDRMDTSESMNERVRDPEDWDEGNTEPPNNFAIYINGKKWKVFQGRGQYADDFREKQHYQQLKDWAQKKSAATGKKWEVYITGERPTA